MLSTHPPYSFLEGHKPPVIRRREHERASQGWYRSSASVCDLWGAYPRRLGCWVASRVRSIRGDRQPTCFVKCISRVSYSHGVRARRALRAHRETGPSLYYHIKLVHTRRVGKHIGGWKTRKTRRTRIIAFNFSLYRYTPALKPGDAVFFTEAATHGTCRGTAARVENAVDVDPSQLESRLAKEMLFDSSSSTLLFRVSRCGFSLTPLPGFNP
jgi:hypothetical protein